MEFSDYEKEVSGINDEIDSILKKRVDQVKFLITKNKQEINSIILDDNIDLINREGKSIKKHEDTSIYLFSNGSDDFYLTITGDIMFYIFDSDTGIDMPHKVDDKLLSLLLVTNSNYLDVMHIINVSPLLEKALEYKKSLLADLKQN